MIGVIADATERSVVSEFFELFKTPWEFFRDDQHYDVLLCSGDRQVEATAKLLIVFAGRKLRFDEQWLIQTGQQRNGRPCLLSYLGSRLPIYGDAITFPCQSNGLLKDEESKECVAILTRAADKFVARVGYDLFAEIRTLFTVGQPAANAELPAVELHIAFLRDLMTGCGVQLIEIPPVPDGYQFAACLTHDVDHPSIRQHKWDHTMFGFLFRAVFGSLRRVVRGQLTFHDLFKNWAAVSKLPFVYLGMAKDFWREFDDRYLELENGLPSTFFLVPFRDQAGRGAHGPAPRLRATRYSAQDLADTIRKLTASNCEVGLHGIDVWLDSSKGCQELEEIRELAGRSEIGVRMHWLYYNQQSASTVEAAGAAYDSTVGYNETVGYRAGTTQVYGPPGTTHLMELPLHAMDTALFYPSYLNLSQKQAKLLLTQMVNTAVRFGGAFTVNWHDRSLAPERLWNKSYRELIQEMREQGAWFATAGQAVSWFRKRRSAAFEKGPLGASQIRVKMPVRSDNLPSLRLRTHKARNLDAIGAQHSGDYVDVAIDENVEHHVPLDAGL
ncbi:MAG TPA: hypothetical protein VIW23_02700 [Candidatus Acidoferrum sp.]